VCAGERERERERNQHPSQTQPNKNVPKPRLQQTCNDVWVGVSCELFRLHRGNVQRTPDRERDEQRKRETTAHPPSRTTLGHESAYLALIPGEFGLLEDHKIRRNPKQTCTWMIEDERRWGVRQRQRERERERVECSREVTHTRQSERTQKDGQTHTRTYGQIYTRHTCISQ
jgi:hypothetical protein